MMFIEVMNEIFKSEFIKKDRMIPKDIVLFLLFCNLCKDYQEI